MDLASHRLSTSPRVAVLSFLFNWPSTGGGIIHTVELVRFLRQAGYEVELIYARYEPWQLGLVDSSCPVDGQVLRFAAAEWTLTHIKRRFAAAVEQAAADVLIITDTWNMKPHLAEAAGGRPYFLRMQALECLCPLNNLRLIPAADGGCQQCPNTQLADNAQCQGCVSTLNRFSGSLHQLERQLAGFGTDGYQALLLRSLRQAEGILVLNSEIARLYAEFDNVHVVTWGMDEARFEPVDSRNENLPSHNESAPALLFCGLPHEPMKGFQFLIRACRTLRRQFPRLRLLVTADEVDDDDEFIHCVGWQSQDELPQLYQLADVTIVPTIAQEGLSRTAVEAMACGCAVVGSRIGGLPDIIEHESCGLLVPPANVEALTAAIRTLLEDASFRQRLGSAGQRRFEERFRWPAVIKKYYRPLLEKARRSMTRYTPVLNPDVDREQLKRQLSEFLPLGIQAVEEMMSRYARVHECMDYARLLGELKTVSFEEALVIYCVLSAIQPATVVEVGVQHGKSMRRMLDMKAVLGLDTRFVGFDVADEVRHFGEGEALLRLEDLTGRVRAALFEELKPQFVFMDAHRYDLLEEILEESKARDDVVLAIHDCSPGLCNPQMTISKTDPISSRTGHWERYVVAKSFERTGPFDEGLEKMETATHRFRIFSTQHGLALLWPKRLDSKVEPELERCDEY